MDLRLVAERLAVFLVIRLEADEGFLVDLLAVVASVGFKFFSRLISFFRDFGGATVRKL
jgi:hypothetical protein